jgi:hypothetical protein
MSAPYRIPAPLLAALLLLLLQWRLLLGLSGPTGDAATFHLPYQMLVGDFARNGELLQWNPWTNGGSPDGAEPQVGAFSPIALACGWIGGGTPWSFLLLWLSSWALAAAGMSALARHLAAPYWAQVGVGLVWATSGIFTGHAGHTCFMHAFALLPWSVRALDRALVGINGRRALHSAVAGAWWGVSALAGYPGCVAVTGLVLGAWALVRCLRDHEVGDRGRVRLPVAIAQLAILVAVAVLVLSPTYIAFFVEGGGFTGRTAPLSREIASGWNTPDPTVSNALEPNCLWSLFHPGIVARACNDAPGLLTMTDPSSASLDAGIAVWVMVILALQSGSRSAWRVGLAAVALAFLGAALGSTLPIRAWLYDLVPPTRYFRHAAVFRGGFLFFVIALGALGSVGIRSPSFGKVAALVTCCWGGAAIAAHAVLGLSPRVADATWWCGTQACGIGLVIASRSGWDHACLRWLLAFGASGIVSSLWMHAPVVESGPERLESFAQQHRGDIELGEAGFDRELAPNILSAQQREAVHSGRWDLLPATANGDKPSYFDNSNLPGKHAVLYGYAALSSGEHLAWAGASELLRVALGRERVFFAVASVNAQKSIPLFEEVTARAKAGELPLVIHDPRALVTTDMGVVPRARLRSLDFKVEQYEPSALRIRIAPQSQDGYVMVTERWANGWQAWIDGQPTDVLQALFLWRSVRVPAGATIIQFRYRLAGYPWLQILSACTWIGIAGAAWIAWRSEASCGIQAAPRTGGAP